MASKLASVPAINVGDIISYKSSSFSVIYADIINDTIVVFERNTTTCNGFSIKPADLFQDIRMGKASVTPGDHSYIVPDENNPIYKTRLAIINEIDKIYRPTYLDLFNGRGKSKPELREIENKLHIGRTLVWKTIHLFFSNGCDKSALYPVKCKHRGFDPDKEYARRGAKAMEADLQSEISAVNNPELIMIFDKYKKRILSNFFYTLSAAYEDMIGKYFSRVSSYTNQDGIEQLSISILPCDIPTYRQFHYWFINNTTIEERLEAQKGVWDYRNNYRALFGDSYSKAYGPGDLTEADHWEVPVYLKSEFSNDTVSKATLSVLMDNYIGGPTTMNLSFDNNSNRALTSLLLSLTRSKKELCAEYGIEISDEDWPSCFCPHIVRVDGGPDFTSYNTVRIVGENQFELQIVPPGMGSYKPNVERFFGSLKIYLASLLEGKGYITNRPNSHPEKEACLTIDDLYHIILSFTVMYYKTMRLNYRPTKEMLQKNVEVSPIGLYKFGAAKYGQPHPIVNKDSFLWSLLMNDEVVYISRNGLLFHKTLEYDVHEDKDLYLYAVKCGKNRKHFEARYDPRDISKLYYLKDGNLAHVSLKQKLSSYKGMTLYEYDQWQKKENKDKRRGKFERLQNKVIARTDANQRINASVSSQGFTPGTRYRRENTLIERESAAKKHTIAKEIESITKDTPCIEETISENLVGSTPVQLSEQQSQTNDTALSMINIRKNMNKTIR